MLSFRRRAFESGPALPLLLLAAAPWLVTCRGPTVPNEPVGEVAPPPARPADGLLESRALQEVVDLQEARDGAGLRALLRSGDPAVRARAAFALGSVQDPEAGSTLAGLLSDPEATVRREAAFALGQLEDPVYGPALLGALNEEQDPDVRARLLEAVGKGGDTRVLEPLLGLQLQGTEVEARNLALSRLGLRGFTLPTSIGHLVSQLENPSPEARENAAYYFGRNRSAAPWAGSATSVRAVLDALGPSDPVAMHLLLGLSLLGDVGDNPRFLAWLQRSPDWRIRANAARGLTGRTGDLRVREALMRALEDPSTHVAVSAADVLTGAQQLTPGEQDDLMEWVREHPQEWRRSGPILALLGRLGAGTFLEEWMENWGEDEVIPRTRGIGAMTFVPTAAATRYLMDAARSSQPRIRATALGGLARRFRAERNDPSVVSAYYQVFTEGLRTGDPSAVFVCAPALADSLFVALGSVEVLREAYEASDLPEDLEGMQAILRALGATGALEAGDLLRREMASETGALRVAAAQGLSALTGEEVEAPPEAAEGGRKLDWEALSTLGTRPRLILETEKGTVALVLDAESAPLTVQTIIGFAREGFYHDTPFHRVVPNFVIQGGDFARQDGFGGPGFSIRSELTGIPYRRGVLGMASAGKDTEGSQFFITHSMAPHLDSGYTSFGWVERGMDVVDILYEEDRILTARVEARGT